MKFDVDAHLAAIGRSVAFLERDGKPASTVTISRSFDAPLLDLWSAVTEAERIPLWFLPITGELKLGGRYQLKGNAGGVVETCEHAKRVGMTWEFGGDVSWVDLRFMDEPGGRSRLTLTHTALLSPHWDTYGPGATGVGWEMGFLGLDMYLSDPEFEKPDAEEFAYSEDGRAIMTSSSNAWADAGIAAGTDPDTAREAARQTTAFYTGQELD